MKEFSFPSKGAGTIHAYRWEPASAPSAIIQLVHGIAEYMPRYDDFAGFLNSKGLLVVAEDHMGHGRSSGTRARLCFEGGWTAAVDDTYELMRLTRQEFPDLPYFLFGHSMGSFMARTLLYRYPEEKLRAAIICGTAWQPSVVLAAGKAFCAVEKKRLGPTGHSPMLTKLMFGAYNNHFRPVKTPNDWICSNPDVVARYTADPLCGEEATVSLASDMLTGISMNQKRKNLKAMPKELPILFIAGKSDPVGNMGKGVERTYREFQQIGMQEVSIHLYDGRHEILNEDNHAEIYEDVWSFIRSKL